MKTLSFYVQKDCGACKEARPAFQEIARLKGWKFKEIDVEKCKTKICNNLDYVPTIYIGKKKIELDELEKLIKE